VKELEEEKKRVRREKLEDQQGVGDFTSCGNFFFKFNSWSLGFNYFLA